ncbi:MAG: hypothetical protein EOM50_09885 [Erysipelotrichia bacterium]|nr:hypothetical protein [Erysipelotrichia bacterium]
MKKLIAMTAIALLGGTLYAQSEYIGLQFQKNNQTGICFATEKFEQSLSKESEIIEYIAELLANTETQLKVRNQYFRKALLPDWKSLLNNENFNNFELGVHGFHLIVHNSQKDISFKPGAGSWGYLSEERRKVVDQNKNYVTSLEMTGDRLLNFLAPPKSDAKKYSSNLMLLHSFLIAHGDYTILFDKKNCESLDWMYESVAIKIFKDIAAKKEQFEELSIMLDQHARSSTMDKFISYLQDPKTMVVYKKMQEVYLQQNMQ